LGIIWESCDGRRLRVIWEHSGRIRRWLVGREINCRFSLRQDRWRWRRSRRRLNGRWWLMI
jgi:hypothetical protein